MTITDQQWEQQSTMNQQQNHRLRTDSSLSHWEGGCLIDVFYWYQIFALDSAVVEAQIC